MRREEKEKEGARKRACKVTHFINVEIKLNIAPL